MARLNADVRWTGDADLANDPKLESLTEKYLKVREGRFRNIAFDANATDGGEFKPTKTLLIQFCQSCLCRTTSKW